MSAIRNVVLGAFLVLCLMAGALASNSPAAPAKKDAPVTPELVIALAKEAGQLEHQAKQAETEAEKAKESLEKLKKEADAADKEAEAKRKAVQTALDEFLKARTKKPDEKKPPETAPKPPDPDAAAANLEAAAEAAKEAKTAAEGARKKVAPAEETATKRGETAKKLRQDADAKNQEFKKALDALVGPKPIEVSIKVVSADPQANRDSSGVYFAPEGAPLSIEVGKVERGDHVTIFVNSKRWQEVPDSPPEALTVRLGDGVVGDYVLAAEVRRAGNVPGRAKTDLRVIKRPPQPRITAVVENDQRLAGVGDIYHVLGWKFGLEVQVAEALPGDKVEACLGDDAKSIGEGAGLHPNLVARAPVTLQRGGTLTLRARVIRSGIAGPLSGQVTVVAPLVLPPAAGTPKSKATRAAPKGPAGTTACSDAEADAPGRPLGDAFEHLPVVRVVPARDEGDGGDSRSKLDAPGFAFDSAAHFPLPQFKRCGCRMDDVGVVIYQGMRFISYGDGHYRVRFVASAPAMPVVLRLQFHVGDSQDCCDVTLPPIRLPEKKSQSVGETEYLVEHEGYLPKKLLAELTHVERKGTARFGHGRIESP